MKKWKNSLIAIIMVVLGISIGAGIYLQGYYRADITVFSELSDSPEYTVEVEFDKIIFNPEKSDTGIIFYPGGLVEFESYVPILKKLAENGIFCALVKMPGNLAMMDIDADERIDRSSYPDIKHWYLAGHSLGGAMAATRVSEVPDRYEGLILLAAYSVKDLKNYPLRVISIYGSCDEVLNKENYEKNKSNLPSDYIEYIIEGGCHGFFGNYGAQKGDGTPTISREEQEDITVEQILAKII